MSDNSSDKARACGPSPEGGWYRNGKRAPEGQKTQEDPKGCKVYTLDPLSLSSWYIGQPAKVDLITCIMTLTTRKLQNREMLKKTNFIRLVADGPTKTKDVSY